MPVDRVRHLPTGLQAYLLARFSLGLPLAALVWTALLPASPDLAWALRTGAGLLVATSAVAAVLLLSMPERRLAVLLAILPFDLAALGLMVFATERSEDPIYPLVAALPLFYAGITRRRSAWYVGVLAALVYLAGHLPGHADPAAGSLAFPVFKAVAIVFTSMVIADTMHRQAQREEEIAQSKADFERLNDRLNRRVSELHAVAEITDVIHSSLEFERVGPLVLDVVQKVIDIPSSCLFVIDKEKGQTLFTASRGLDGVRAEDLTAADLLGPNGAELDHHYSCMTVLDHNHMMVVFCAEADSLESLTQEDLLVLQAVSSELMVAVENSRLYTLTKRLSITDELTGLYNYRYLQQRLDEELGRAARYGRHVSLIMLDVDDFKRLNDMHGHLVGDAALAELGEVLRRSVREIDVVARYGGEEFSVILPETDAAGAFVVAEKVRESVADHAFPDADGERRVRVTISLGLATYPTHAPDKEALLREADDALYQAKRLGKDGVRTPQKTQVAPDVGEAEEAG